MKLLIGVLILWGLTATAGEVWLAQHHETVIDIHSGAPCHKGINT
jgi:hypothetical protein